MDQHMDYSTTHAASARNRVRDALRALPVELQTLCWSFLPFRDIFRLALVCRHWRDVSASCAQLWNVLRLDSIPEPSATQQIYARSGQMPVRLALSVLTCEDWARLAGCLRILAPRLYDLRMVLEFPIAELHEDAQTLHPLRFDAPVLSNLSISVQSDSAELVILWLWEDTFNNYAPNLQSVDLYGVGLPEICPAFRDAKSVWLGTTTVNLDALFSLFPNVTRLGYDNIKPHTLLPPVPRHVQLQEFMLIDDSDLPMSLHDMAELGYLRFPKVTLRSRSIWMLQMAAARGDEFTDTTLIITDHDRAELSLGTREDRTTYLCADPSDPRDLLHLLPMASISNHLQHLVLPLYFPGTDSLISQGIALPRMLSLSITCGDASASGLSHSLLDPAYSLGVIYAPVLSRLELRRDTGYSGPLEPVDLEHLAFFIADCLIVGGNQPSESGSNFGDFGGSTEGEPEDQRESESVASDHETMLSDTSQPLELRIDTANGVRLRGKTTQPVYFLRRDLSGRLSFRCD